MNILNNSETEIISDGRELDNLIKVTAIVETPLKVHFSAKILDRDFDNGKTKKKI